MDGQIVISFCRCIPNEIVRKLTSCESKELTTIHSKVYIVLTDITPLINRLSNNIHDSAKSSSTNRHLKDK